MLKVELQTILNHLKMTLETLWAFLWRGWLICLFLIYEPAWSYYFYAKNPKYGSTILYILVNLGLIEWFLWMGLFFFILMKKKYKTYERDTPENWSLLSDLLYFFRAVLLHGVIVIVGLLLYLRPIAVLWVVSMTPYFKLQYISHKITGYTLIQKIITKGVFDTHEFLMWLVYLLIAFIWLHIWLHSGGLGFKPKLK